MADFWKELFEESEGRKDKYIQKGARTFGRAQTLGWTIEFAIEDLKKAEGQAA